MATNAANKAKHNTESDLFAPERLETTCNTNSNAEADAKDDLFNPERLTLPQSFDQMVGVKTHVTVVPVRKPNRQSYIRVHSNPAYQRNFALLKLEDEDEVYLVEPTLVPQLQEEVSYCTLFTGITREGNVFLWPVRMPDPDGRSNSWNE